MLSLHDFSVSIGEKDIIQNFHFSFETGKTYAILGENGSGKSSLTFGVFHHPKYQTSGVLRLHENDISHASPDTLSAHGLFLSFQNVPEISGIRLIEYLRTIYTIHYTKKHPDTKAPTPFVFRRMVEKLLPEYGLESSFLERDLYVGFSGGEKRRIEMLQIALLDPKYIFLDEIDAGLDIGAIQILASEIEKWHTNGKTCIIISHNFHLLESIHIDQVLIMKDGNLIEHGEKVLIENIRKDGF